MKTKVGIIDYGMGNLLSLSRAISYLGAEPIIILNAEELHNTDVLVLPGVGAFPDGMKMLESKHFADAIRMYVKTGKSFMGICLGMQMMLGKGFEFKETKGLNLIEGTVMPLPASVEYKVPNINWHEIHKPGIANWDNTFLSETKEGTNFYFVHSYYAAPQNQDDVLATTNFGGIEFASVIKRDNVLGTQFHPEKSGKDGLKLLEVFLRA